MGCYHNTVLTLTAPANAKLLDVLQRSADEFNELFAEAVSFQATDRITKVTLYHWDFYKWSDDEQLFISAFIETISENDYRYIRLSENNDIEYLGELEEPFYPQLDAKLIYNKLNPQNEEE